MNNNNFSAITDQQTITSIEIAEITGKEHYNVLKAIRKMEPAWEKIAAVKFNGSLIKDKSGKLIPMYILTKTECLFVATKFNDEARAKLVLRWEQLEKERLSGNNRPLSDNNRPLSDSNRPLSDSNLPVDPRNMSRLQILQMALAAEEEKERLRAEKEELEADKYGLMIENGQKDEQIRMLEERTAYMNVIDCQRDTVIVSQIAQDYGMSAVAFNDLLKGLRVQRKMGEQWILYADYLNKGYVANRMIPIHHAGRADTYKPMTVWTQSGRRFLYEKLKKHGVLPLVERNMLALPHS